MKLFKSFLNICLIIVVIFFLFPQLNIPGSYKIFLVQSGSMSPTINTGDVIVVSPTKNYRNNDIITFSGPSFTITHRIVNSNSSEFITKGDANKVVDQDKISQNKIIGKVVCILPKIGYIAMFSKSLLGLILLIVIPSTIIVWQELIKIKHTIVHRNN